jgi:hypothetical protein
VGRVATVTVSVDKIEGLDGGRGEYEAQDVLVRAFISAASAATGPEHADIERIDSTRPPHLTGGNIAVIPKSKDPAYVTPPLPSHPPPFARLGRRRRPCMVSIPFLRRFCLSNKRPWAC